MDNIEKREINILESNEKLEDFKNSLKEKLVERLLNTPLQEFSFDAYGVCFTVIVPKTDEFPYAVKLHMEHYESRTGLDIDWKKVESGDTPKVYEVHPAEMHVYTSIYEACVDGIDDVKLHKYARAIRCAAYNAPSEFNYKYDSENDPETYDKLYKLYIDALASYKARCENICKAYTKECWKLFDVISNY